MKNVPAITDARPSRADELHYRERRYIVMMSIRAICLIGATVIVTAHVPLGWLWATILVIGAVVLPWLAVMLANDRVSRKNKRYAPAVIEDAPQRTLTSPVEGPAPRIIEYEP